ncbi:prepilin-type N-terminal cleavage/methylation domain-containing protein [Clostridium sp. MB40-C1]|uniref:prepilin-type N-terminal cleavage/methylation domain-containing protein n=1 Tax=Clostridium sp. MB40-C1 TaxID=3070996 RepID=UPI0027E0EE8E|nr:prepilin-type N-terminal cleavage/methylation domain-containing protein [Clostridium sp. MB40-C1]WMJ80845.1 prepilin-type N-terminal cleavage/methylation domain-containing protein [Clostridium sp. MB40-C1]
MENIKIKNKIGKGVQKMKDTKKGITLIELIIVIALIGIILIPISNFFLTSYSSLHKVDKEIELQSQGEEALEKFVKISMISSGIQSIKKHNEELKSQKKCISVDRIVLKNSSSSSEVDDYDVFQLLDNKLWYGRGEKDLDATKIGKVIGKNIYSIDIEGTKDLKEAEGIYIVINLSYKNVKSAVESKVYFRNK